MGNRLETELIERCLAGERKAFEELLRQYQKPVYNVAYRIVGNPDDAADITQVVFLKAFEKLDRYKPEYRFFSWIYRIAINESINYNRHRGRQQSLEGNESAATSSPDAEAEASQQSREIQESLMQLNPDYRTVVVLRHFSDLSYREISEVLDTPEKTIKSRLYSARQLMKEALLDRGAH